MKFRLAGLVALMALVIASCGGTSPEAGGPSEGVQVHGDWTIDIYNEDGSLDESVEFSNALQFGGERTLNQLLGGNVSPSGLWRIGYGTSVSDADFIDNVQADNGATGDGDARLVGSATAEAGGTISYVETRMGTCSATTAPQSCTADSNGFIFTSTNLAGDDIATVSAGQTIQIEVVISFTSG